MTCDNFKEQLHRLLTLESPGDLPAELEAHLAECVHCGIYREEILNIHRELQHIPIVAPSPQTIDSIIAIEKSHDELPVKLGWDLERKLVLPITLVVALMWYAQHLENYTGVIIQVVVMTCVLTIGFIATLQSYFFPWAGFQELSSGSNSRPSKGRSRDQ